MPKTFEAVKFPYLHVVLSKEDIDLHNSKLLFASLGLIHLPRNFIRRQFSPSR